MTNKNLSPEGLDGLARSAGMNLKPSQIIEVAEKLPGDKFATIINAVPLMTKDLTDALSSEKMSSERLADAAPYMNIGQVAFLKQHYPAAYAKLAPGLPEGVEGVIDQYYEQNFNVVKVFSGDKSWMVPDGTMKEIADLQRQGKIPPPPPRVGTSK
jgi:hypothetical protein